MKREKRKWWFLLLAGSAPFLAAFGYCLAGSLLDGGGPLWRMSFGDYLIFYSFLYWPTYAAGVLLIVLSVLKLRKRD